MASDKPTAPREFWIKQVGHWPGKDEVHDSNPQQSGFIHVIEYAALDHMANCFAAEQDKRLKAEAENERLGEILSYLPKVPTEPYEKAMAKEILELHAEVERLKQTLQIERGNASDGYWKGLAEMNADIRHVIQKERDALREEVERLKCLSLERTKFAERIIKEMEAAKAALEKLKTGDV